MEVEKLPLDGLLLVKPRLYRDDRGFMLETYREPTYRAAGIATAFVQDNHSQSARDTLRGMHFQRGVGQAKLVRAATGRILDVVVDLRRESPSFKQWHAVELDAEQHHQLYVPVGFAHGFCVLSERADVVYKVSAVYDPALETGFHYADPAIGIAWPVAHPAVSERDRTARAFAEIVTGGGR